MAVLHQPHSARAGVLPGSKEKNRWHEPIVQVSLLIIVAFQLVNLPAAILNPSFPALLVSFLGLTLCGMALFFHYLGRKGMVSVLLIVVVNLSCGLTLLMAPGGLDIGMLPLFDVLIVSELIAVSLLSAESVFPVALANVLFTLTDLLFQPHTAALDRLLSSTMGYSAIVHPVSLQIVVAIVTYLWVRSTHASRARADRAEEVVAWRKREAEYHQQLDAAVEHMSQVLVRTANGDRRIRIDLSRENVLWRLGNSLNVLMARLARASQVEEENQRLRMQVAQLSEAMKETRAFSRPGRDLPFAPHDRHSFSLSSSHKETVIHQ